MSNNVHTLPRNRTRSTRELRQRKTPTECDGGGANPRKKEESFTYCTEQHHGKKNTSESRNPKSWTALSTSLFGSLPLLWASHVVRRVHLDPGNSNEAPTGNREEREEEQIKREENAVESKQKRRQHWDMALTYLQHCRDLKMGKGKAPSESNVSTRDIRHQAQSTSASVFNRTRQGSTYLGTETKRWILASTSGCGFLLCPQRHCLKY